MSIQLIFCQLLHCNITGDFPRQQRRRRTAGLCIFAPAREFCRVSLFLTRPPQAHFCGPGLMQTLLKNNSAQPRCTLSPRSGCSTLDLSSPSCKGSCGTGGPPVECDAVDLYREMAALYARQPADAVTADLRKKVGAPDKAASESSRRQVLVLDEREVPCHGVEAFAISRYAADDGYSAFRVPS